MGRQERRHPQPATYVRAKRNVLEREMQMSLDPETGKTTLTDPNALPPVPEGDPCYGCDCCTRWQGLLAHLRAAIAQHRPSIRRRRCPVDGCVVCSLGESW